MSLRDKVKSYDKKYGTGNFWKPEEGQNQIRFLTEPELFDDVYEGEPAGSFIAYILVRDSGGEDSFALFTLPKSLVRWLADQEELGKFSGYPMSFDVMLFKQTTGKKTTYVSVAVEPANSLVITTQQQAVLSAAKPIVEVAQALAKKKSGNMPHTQPALPAEVVEKHNQLARQKAKAEMNPMYTAIEMAINNADTEEKIIKTQAMVTVSFGAGTIDDFENDLLVSILQAKQKKLGTQPLEDIKVEDIPF